MSVYPVKAWQVLFLREMGRIDVRRKVLVSCVGNRLERSKREAGSPWEGAWGNQEKGGGGLDSGMYERRWEEVDRLKQT